MEKQLAQIMLDTMLHLVCEPLEKRVAELEGQVREFKHVSTWEAEQQYKERQLRYRRRQPWRCPAVCNGDAASWSSCSPGTWVAYRRIASGTDRRWCTVT